MLALHEELFREHGIDSVEQLRARHAAGRLPQPAPRRIGVKSTGSAAVGAADGGR